MGTQVINNALDHHSWVTDAYLSIANFVEDGPGLGLSVKPLILASCVLGADGVGETMLRVLSAAEVEDVDMAGGAPLVFVLSFTGGVETGVIGLGDAVDAVG
jgi:hypothetical protein